MSYEVKFYREIVNSYGKPSRVSVYTAQIETPASMDEAIASAIGTFKRERGLSCWTLLADGYQVTYEARGIPMTTGGEAVGAADGRAEGHSRPRDRSDDHPRDPAARPATARL